MRAYDAAALLALLLAPAAMAEPLTGAEFEAEVTGRTLGYGIGGMVYGTEQYLPGRRVIWAFTGEACRYGQWYEDPPGRICFTYEHDPTPQCWRFWREPTGLRARFEGESGTDLVEVSRSPHPLQCPGPEVGA